MEQLAISNVIDNLVTRIINSQWVPLEVETSANSNQVNQEIRLLMLLLLVSCLVNPHWDQNSNERRIAMLL